jgi:hypothetical protein
VAKAISGFLPYMPSAKADGNDSIGRSKECNFAGLGNNAPVSGNIME